MPASYSPPGPRSFPPGVNMLRMSRDPLGYLTNLARQYGDIVRFSIGSTRMILVNDPDAIQAVLVKDHRNFTKGRGLQLAKHLLGEGLVTSEGEYHRKQRRLVQPVFHRQRIASYAESMTRYAVETRERWRDGETIETAHEMSRLTLSIVGKTLFGTDVEIEANEIGEALTQAMGVFRYVSLPGAQHLIRMPFPPVRRFERGRDRLDATIYRLIAEHRAGKSDQDDLLSMLLSAQDEDDGSEGGSEDDTSELRVTGGNEGTGTGETTRTAFGKSKTATRMSDKQVRDEAITLFLAGHETTANALAWTWYLLARNSEVEARFHAEIDSVLQGCIPTYEDVPKLPYTRQILAESMRLYPPAWIVARRAINDYTLATSQGNVDVPAHTILMFCEWVTHRDPRWYPNPDRFDPDRFTPEAMATRPKFAYYPFGGGARICIGEQFAWMEGILLLATIGQQWSLHVSPGLPAQDIPPSPLVTLRPARGMPLVPRLREAVR